MHAANTIQIISGLVTIFLLISQSSAERGLETGNIEKRLFINGFIFICPHPPSVKDGTLSCSTTNYLINTQCHLACHSTFTPSHPTITCTYHQELKKPIWNASPSCRATRCASSPTTSHGSYRCPHSIHSIGQVCSLICSTGYRYSSTTHTVTCHTGGVWSRSATCLEIRCPTPPAISHGTYHCLPSTVHKYAQVCTLSCSTGYKPSTSHSSITCRSDSKWSTHASCVEIRCPTPHVSHGSFHCTSTSVHKQGSSCTLRCSTGYRPSSSHTTISCTSHSTWSASLSCVEIKCPSPPKVTSGVYQCTHTTTHKLNEVCHLHCNTGFRPSSTSSDIKCLSNNKWSTTHTCVEIKCPSPPKVSNGVYQCAHTTTHKLNEVCHLHCNTGFKPSSTASDVKCLSTDKWSSPATCVEIKCPAPSKVSNGAYHCTKTTHKLNDVCHLQCNTGFKPSSASTDIHCLSTDKWSTAGSCVEIKCPSPPKVTNGVYQCAHTTTHKLNEACHLQCNTGFKPSSATSDIKCLSTDHWSTKSTCVEIKCPAPPTVNNGVYYCNNTIHKLNDVCHLQCNTGFRQSSASTDIHCLTSDKWSTAGSCVDATPPTFTDCPSSQTVVLRPDETFINLTWSQVKAADPPGDGPVTVTLLTDLEPGSNVSAGNYPVTYEATDQAGNKAIPCTFTIVVLDGCPKGSYQDVENRKCMLCPVGTYQEQENSLECVSCSWGLSTASQGTTDVASCRGSCPPGSSSPDSLAPCSLCPTGSYQGMPGSKSCDLCPQGQTTLTEGAMEIQDCTMP